MDLLVANRGLLVLTPVIVAALAGVVLLRRGRHRTEANVIIAVAAVYFVYNAGYWLTFGGGTPGPRFLIPALPFVAVGLAPAYRRFPAVTLALAIPSAVFMVVAALTFPLLGENGPGTWLEFLWDGRFEHTVLTVAGVSNAWLALLPVIAALIAAIALAVRATPATPLGDLRLAVVAVLAWIPIAVLGPGIAGDKVTPLDGDPNLIYLVAAGAAASLLALVVLSRRRPRRQPGEPGEAEDESPASPSAPEPALGSSS